MQAHFLLNALVMNEYLQSFFSIQMNVSSECIDACSFHLDMDNIMDRPECMNDFEKLMKCAADGSGKLETKNLAHTVDLRCIVTYSIFFQFLQTVLKVCSVL